MKASRSARPSLLVKYAAVLAVGHALCRLEHGPGPLSASDRAWSRKYARWVLCDGPFPF